MIVYGPVPSRRLGRSIGINNIPLKNCSYSCVYCQVGKTSNKTAERKEFYSTDEILKEVENKLTKLANKSEKVDYLSFVPDGEPTLDINLGKTIKALKQFGIKIAVITNSSLIWDNKVREDLFLADWVSVKIDTVFADVWQRINHPEKSLMLNEILTALEIFKYEYSGELVTETMIVDRINDEEAELKETAIFIQKINPNTAYILVPMRPPAVKINQPNETKISLARAIFEKYNNNVKLINYNEGNKFSSFTHPIDELLSILSVHPMREDAIKEYLANANLERKELEKLINSKLVKEVSFNNILFYQLNKEV